MEFCADVAAFINVSNIVLEICRNLKAAESMLSLGSEYRFTWLFYEMLRLKVQGNRLENWTRTRSHGVLTLC